MIEVAAPSGGASDEVRSFAACIAAILEVPVEEVPCPPTGDPWVAWREWLAARGLALVPILDPASFACPGFWIARAGTRAVVMFGVPAGVALDPLDGAGGVIEPEAGWALAALDPRETEGDALGLASSEDAAAGRVEAIVLAPAAGVPASVVKRARALAGRGLEGDRYASGSGTFSGPGTGRSLTLVEAEALEELVLPGGGRLAPAEARRNVVTRGIALNRLVGRRFMVGEVECIGRRLCEPCAHLERLTSPGVLRGLVHRGGLRADLLTDGEIAIGDVVRALG